MKQNNNNIKEKTIAEAVISFGIPILLFVLLYFFSFFNDIVIFVSANYFLLCLAIVLSILSVFLLSYSISNFRNIIRLSEVIDNNISELKKCKNDTYYLLDSMLSMVYVTDINCKINWANGALLNLYGEAIGKSINEIFHYNNNEPQLSLINRVLISNEIEKSIVYYPSKTLFSTETYIEHRAIPIINIKHKKIEAIIVVSTNITSQMQLSESKQRLSLMVSASKDAIFVIDINKQIISWNKGAEEIFGYLRDEIIGQPITILDHLINFNVLASIFDLDEITETKTIKNVENVEIKGLNFSRIVDFTVYPFFDDIGSVIGISSIVRDRTDTIKAKQALELSEIQMRKLASHLDDIREKERKEIAFIVHDELGYALSAIKMDINWLRRNMDKISKNNITERTDDMLKLVDVTIQNVKQLSSNLRPSILDHFGLIAAIEEQAREFQRRTGIRCKVNIKTNDDICIPESIRTPIFRIFQEAQTNITRYAKASRVDVNISYYNNLFVLEVIDNGIGIPENKINAVSSFGLLGIREKASFIGGKIFISGKKDEGTKIRLELNITL
jgi:PAS domain S-box-containing protein